jgi:hypothetical protein
MESTGFEQSLQAVATRPYRRFIADRMDEMSSEALEQAVGDAGRQLPDRLQSQVPVFLDAARDKFLQSRLFWEASTCREALANILELAAEVIEDDEVWTCHKRPFEGGGALAGRFFELATAYFASQAAMHDGQRRLMGIKKGWLR